jgi:hypothetical protein
MGRKSQIIYGFIAASLTVVAVQDCASGYTMWAILNGMMATALGSFAVSKTVQDW